MTDNNYFDNFPSTKSYGPHVLYIKITTSSKAMRVYAELYLSVMGALSVMGVYTLAIHIIQRYTVDLEISW